MANSRSVRFLSFFHAIGNVREGVVWNNLNILFIFINFIDFIIWLTNMGQMKTI